ncbi:unnamed protein product [Menidia menidia]|uniref:Zinc finger protein 532 n=1 Tax=Menidia menidia TaxID=238744 RepID=A0A8S4AMP1_9TELE|nr:unnamed protein product [Menidia menidia]
MGDMKTPDFDDLLAAFDLPDMVDPKAAIESGHQDEHVGQLKQPSGGVTTNEVQAHQSSTAHDIGVSVIVKNIQNMEASEYGGIGTEKDGHPSANSRAHSLSSGPQNGCLPKVLLGPHCTKNGWKAPRDEGHKVNNQPSTFNQFSPISSAEEFDDDDRIEVDEPSNKPGAQTFFRPGANPEDQRSPIIDGASNPKAHSKDKLDQNNNGTFRDYKSNNPSPSTLPDENNMGTNSKSKNKAYKDVGDSPELTDVSSISQGKARSSTKLSSCIAAIVALSAKKASAEDMGFSDSPKTHKEFVQAKDKARASEITQEQDSAIEFAKKLLTRPPDSPSSVTSESSSRGSPASNTDTTPVIPKVRIKTIKTSSGQIKRTVTRVLPELDPEGLNKGDNKSCLLTTTGAILSSTTRPNLSTTVVTTSGGSSIEITKQVTIKPVATAFLPVSAVKTAGSQVINLKLANNTTVKATVIPAASVQSASSAILKAANAIQQQTVMVPASSLANAKLVPKAVHFSNLNLLPQSVSSAACDLQPDASSSKQSKHQQSQPVKQQTTGQASKKVPRVQVFSSSQSSVVEAFNKVLSSMNPVPVYVPNLSPPSSACISLPSRGYKCLECGDSFALEKSLTQHYERRSVRIEVTCNHCAKGLVFYNKCSLLSHARGHKDKGVVMQCSHLILKPIPADQMISTFNSSGPPAITCTTSTSPVQAPTSQTQGKVAGGGNGTAVISAPCNAPLVAAMPLEDDASKLCRHSLKCLECNEMFQDDSSLAMHYQQSPDTSSQSHVTKNCLHYTRRVGYRCIHCSVIFADVAALKSHLQSTHCEIFYKCPLCPMAFKSAPGTHSHAYTQHPGVKPGEPKMIYKCSMCDTVFTLQSLLYTHFDQHVVNHKVSVFKCPDCSTHYAQKQLMLDHIKAIHGTLKTIEGPPNLGINLPLSSKPTNSNSNSLHSENIKDGGIFNSQNSQDKREKKPSPSPLRKANSNCAADFKSPPSPGYSCGECKSPFSSRELFVTHMRREHGKSQSCKRKSEEDEMPPGLNSRDTEAQPLKRLKVNILKVRKCAVCGFNTEDVAVFHKHIPQHKSDGSSYQCQECGLCYTSHRSLARHLFIVHRLKEPKGLGRYIGRSKEDEESQRENQLDSANENDDGTPNTKCKVCGKTFETEGILNMHMRTHGMAFIKSKRLSVVEK